MGILHGSRGRGRLRRAVAGSLAVLGFLALAAPAGAALVNGRSPTPYGRMTVLGDFPTGGAFSPDGRFYWAVDSGYGHNDVQIVRVSDGVVVQVLPLPGGYGSVAFRRDGRRAYVSG